MALLQLDWGGSAIGLSVTDKSPGLGGDGSIMRPRTERNGALVHIRRKKARRQAGGEARQRLSISHDGP